MIFSRSWLAIALHFTDGEGQLIRWDVENGDEHLMEDWVGEN